MTKECVLDCKSPTVVVFVHFACCLHLHRKRLVASGSCLGDLSNGRWEIKEISGKRVLKIKGKTKGPEKKSALQEIKRVIYNSLCRWLLVVSHSLLSPASDIQLLRLSEPEREWCKHIIATLNPDAWVQENDRTKHHRVMNRWGFLPSNRV